MTQIFFFSKNRLFFVLFSFLDRSKKKEAISHDSWSTLKKKKNCTIVSALCNIGLIRAVLILQSTNTPTVRANKNKRRALYTFIRKYQ